MDDIAVCLHCGTELTENYGECFMEDLYVIRHIYGFCEKCGCTYEWEDVYTFLKLREVKEYA